MYYNSNDDANAEIDKADEMSIIGCCSTEGTSHGSGKPSVLFYQGFLRFLCELRKRGVAAGSSREARYLFEAVGLDGLLPYIRFAREAAPGQDRTPLAEVAALIELESRLRPVILAAVSTIEMQLRAQYHIHAAAERGDFCLYEPSMFRDEAAWRKSMRKLDAELARQARRGAAVRHRLESGARVPLGMALSVSSLGTLTSLLGNTALTGVVSRVAASFNTDMRTLVSWMKAILAARNSLSHQSPYIVRLQIPSVPLRARWSDDDNTAPLYLLVVLRGLLSGRVSHLSVDDGVLEEFNREVNGLLAGFSNEYSQLATALRIPGDFAPAPLDDWRARLRMARAGGTSYYLMELAA